MTRNPFRNLLRRAAREDGSVTVDFVLVFPVFIMVFLASFEAAMMMTRFVMLERALDISIRDLRLGVYTNPTHDQIKADICARTILLPDCEGALLLEMRPVSRVSWDVFAGTTQCVDRTEDLLPVTTFNPGAENELMLIRACAIFDPFFPTTRWGLRLPLDASGGYQLLAMSAFVNEPR
jgi:hypothetical protein